MKKEYLLLREIRRLKSIRGSGTELISIYVPAGFQISEELSKLREELSQSSNIKSKTTRSNVQSAIEKIMQYLKLYKETPKNGLVVFCGNISDTPGREDIELFSMEPPLPLKVNIYRCDSTFLLEPIEDMVEARNMYALVVLDGREATIASLKGPEIRVVKKLNSTAHAKVRKGGQSARRYERLIEESIGDYYKRIGESINSFFAEHQFNIKGLIIGGPGPAKEGFVKSGTLNYQIKTLGVFDTGYTDEYGLHELVDKAKDLLTEEESSQERTVLERFMQDVVRGLAVHGYESTKRVLESRQASKLIINKDIEVSIEARRNNSNGATIGIVYSTYESTKQLIAIDDSKTQGDEAYVAALKERIKARSPQERADALKEVALRYTGLIGEPEDAIEKLIGTADESGVETVFVSSESSYGKEFLMGFGGIGAMLRYK